MSAEKSLRGMSGRSSLVMDDHSQDTYRRWQLPDRRSWQTAMDGVRMNRIVLLIMMLVGSSTTTACTHTSSHVTRSETATLSVHLGLFGSGPTGSNAPTFSDSPLVADVTAVDAHGVKHVATTDGTGTA